MSKPNKEIVRELESIKNEIQICNQTILDALNNIHDALTACPTLPKIAGSDQLPFVTPTDANSDKVLCNVCKKMLPISEFAPSELRLPDDQVKCRECRSKIKGQQAIDRWADPVKKLLSVGLDGQYVKSPDKWTHKRLGAVFDLSPTTMENIMREMYNRGMVDKKVQGGEYVYFLPGNCVHYNTRLTDVDLIASILNVLPTKSEAETLVNERALLCTGVVHAVADALGISESHASVTLERMVASGDAGCIPIYKRTKWGGTAKKLYYKKDVGGDE